MGGGTARWCRTGSRYRSPVELSTPPSRVIETVLRALQDGPLENVVLDPKPTVVMMEFKDGVGI